MRWIIALIVCISTSACGGAHQPESVQTVAAYEVPLLSQPERDRFLSLLRDAAKDHDMHVDAASVEELERRAKETPEFKLTMSAAVWMGKSDDESVASAMDQPGRPGHVWLTFSKGENPQLSASFREATMSLVMRNWPQTLSLPIMPTGAIPLHRDLLKTPNGYVVDPRMAHKYALPSGKTAESWWP